MAGVRGFEPPIYSLGGCRLILARLHAHNATTLRGDTHISTFLETKAHRCAQTYRVSSKSFSRFLNRALQQRSHRPAVSPR